MAMKRIVWLAMLGALYIGMMGAGSCGNKARDQIGKAREVIDDAREARAPEYAPDEFHSAEESLLLAQEQYDRLQFKRAETSASIAESNARQALEISLAAMARDEEEERRLREEEEAAQLAYNVSSLFGATNLQPSLEEQASTALHDVHFAFDSFDLSEAAKNVLNINAVWLSEHATIKVEIEGHTDERGTDEYNLALGAKRAKVVYDYLVQKGIESSRLKTISYGESVPVDPRSNEEAWSANRRAHFAVMQ